MAGEKIQILVCFSCLGGETVGSDKILPIKKNPLEVFFKKTIYISTMRIRYRPDITTLNCPI